MQDDLGTRLKKMFLQGQGVITQQAGAYNPQIEKFSGGVNYGTDIGVNAGTPINVPKGNYSVLDAYSGAQGGWIGNNQNSGYGNSVLLKNNDTGETYRLSHLSQVGVKPGAFGGGLLGYTGATGNVTGAHLDVEAYNPQGQIETDYGGILKSLRAPSQSTPKLDLASVFNTARQKYGGLVAVSTDPNKLKSMSRNPNAQVIKI